MDPTQLPATLGSMGGNPPGLPTTAAQEQSNTPQDPTQKIIDLVIKAAQSRPQFGNQPVPSPIPENRSNIPPGYMQQNQNWGPERFMYTLSANIQNAWNQKKKEQLAQAESDWNLLQTGIQSGNQQLISSIVNDPKKLKQMAKALNQDWMNPEKTSVYGEALKASLAKQQQKQQAKEGLMATMKDLIHRAFKTNQQPQLSDQQRQQIGQEVMRKAPIVTPPADMKTAAESAKAFLDLEKAQQAMRENYNVITAANGSLYAYNKTNPKDVQRLTDENGNPIIAAKKAGAQPKVASLGGIPYGVARDGKIVTPDSPDWTGEDGKVFAAAKGAAAESQANMLKRAELVSDSRALAYSKSREYGVLNKLTGEEGMVNALEINQNPEKYAPISPAAKVMSQHAIFGEIDFTKGMVNEAIQKLGNEGFDAKSRAQIAAVLRDTDPRSAWSSFVNSSVGETLSPAQIDYVSGLVSLDESAMSLRTVAGQGQGSDAMRSRITKMLPGPNTPSKQYAERQMQLFDGELQQLKRGIPNLGARGIEKKGAPGDTPPANLLKEGRNTKFSNGQVWTLRNGKPVQVQ